MEVPFMEIDVAMCFVGVSLVSLMEVNTLVVQNMSRSGELL